MLRWVTAVSALAAAGSLLFGTTSNANASIVLHTSHLTGKQVACSLTSTEFMYDPGGSVMHIKQGALKFSAETHGRLSDPYITAGYNQSLNSMMCNSHPLANGTFGRSFPLPAKLGRAGRYYGSSRDWTSRNFRGNISYDMWLTRNPANNTYAKLVNQGMNTTEIMIWLSHPRLYGYHKHSSVIIDGKHWNVYTGLPRPYGWHGVTSHRKGWAVVGFLSPDTSTGNVSFRNLYLNPFISYASKHHYLNRSDYLMSIDHGAEIFHGSMAVNGYSLVRR